jgi:hypothetical protein
VDMIRISIISLCYKVLLGFRGFPTVPGIIISCVGWVLVSVLADVRTRDASNSLHCQEGEILRYRIILFGIPFLRLQKLILH